MSYALTFVAADPQHTPLQEAHIDTYGPHDWLSAGKAASVRVTNPLDVQALTDLRTALNHCKIDIFQTPAENRRKKLLLADMDSTIVEGETLDELAAFAGLKDKIAAITARAMNGELDFHAAIRERVGLLKGLNATTIEATLAATIVNPGAHTLVQTMKNHGCTCVLVSGGFTLFTAPIAEAVGFDHNHGNTLHIENGVLTGTVADPILDKDSKVAFLQNYIEKLGITAADCMTIGDGANDVPMLLKAGFGIAYHAKPTVQSQITNQINHGDLSSALYAQGYRDDDIAFE